MTERDWRLPEHRRELFQRFYSFHLEYRAHPGCVYFMLPALADTYDLDADGRAWLVWLNGNTQNPVMSELLLQIAPTWQEWRKATDFVSDNFKLMDWDTDRRYFKAKFGQATEQWAENVVLSPAEDWLAAGAQGWDRTWGYALSQPYMGRLSAWSMTEYARILLGKCVPDAATLMLEDKSGSRSHRNGLGLLAGYDATYWGPEGAEVLGIVDGLRGLGEDLLSEAQSRNPGHPDVSYLTLESTLCTYKSFHKPDRRYPGVYLDMHYDRIVKAEQRFGWRFDTQWGARRGLPRQLARELDESNPGLSRVKQNAYRETGRVLYLGAHWPDMRYYDHTNLKEMYL